MCCSFYILRRADGLGLSIGSPSSPLADKIVDKMTIEKSVWPSATNKSHYKTVMKGKNVPN